MRPGNIQAVVNGMMREGLVGPDHRQMLELLVTDAAIAIHGALGLLPKTAVPRYLEAALNNSAFAVKNADEYRIGALADDKPVIVTRYDPNGQAGEGRGCYRAFLGEIPELYGAGISAEEAINKLMLLLQDTDHTDPADYQIIALRQ